MKTLEIQKIILNIYFGTKKTKQKQMTELFAKELSQTTFGKHTKKKKKKKKKCLSGPESNSI